MESILKNLALDAWYKAFIYVGAILFGIGLLRDVKGITNEQLLLLGAGFFFIGIGEWKNRKVISEFKPANAYTGPAGIVSGKIRQPDMVGISFVVIGIIFLLLAVWLIVEPYALSLYQQYIKPEINADNQPQNAIQALPKTTN